MVDDQLSWLHIARTILTAAGYQVQVCGHPVEASLLLKGNPERIDLVISDLNMPELDGLQFATELLKVKRAMRVVLTSAASVELTPTELQRAGLRDFLPKPWERKRLLSVIRQALTTT